MSQPKINWSSSISEKIASYNTKCVIGLDRDGTINEDLGTYLKSPDEFTPIPGSLEAVTKIRSLGHKIVIITNQGGIEKGVVTQQQVESVNQRMMDLLGQAGCKDINGLYYSTSSRKNDMYAKPNTGMFKRCETENKDIKFSKYSNIKNIIDPYGYINSSDINNKKNLHSGYQGLMDII